LFRRWLIVDGRHNHRYRHVVVLTFENQMPDYFQSKYLELERVSVESGATSGKWVFTIPICSRSSIAGTRRFKRRTELRTPSSGDRTTSGEN
jgi:hypothetical protein